MSPSFSATDFGILRVKFRFSWGFSLRLPGASASEPTLRLPPPTTLIGALARGLAYTLNLPETFIHEGEMVSTAEKLNEIVKSAHLTLLVEGDNTPLWSVINDITRMQALQYLQPSYWTAERMDTWFGVHSVGKVYIPSVLSEAAYLVDRAKAERRLGEEWREILLKSALATTTVGVKESIVSVEDAKLTPVRHVLTQASVNSKYYFPVEAVNPLDLTLLRDELMEDEYWDHRDRRTRILDPSGTMTAERIPYLIPLGRSIPKPVAEEELPRLRFRLSGEGVALTDLELVDEALRRGEFLVTLRRWLV